MQPSIIVFFFFFFNLIRLKVAWISAFYIFSSYIYNIYIIRIYLFAYSDPKISSVRYKLVSSVSAYATVYVYIC